MGFIFKCAFWLSLVLLIIPIDVSDQQDPGTAIGPIDAFFAAREAVGDISGMCERKPHVCEVGRSAAQTITLRAREGARMAAAALNDQPAPIVEPAKLPEVDVEIDERRFASIVETEE